MFRHALIAVLLLWPLRPGIGAEPGKLFGIDATVAETAFAACERLPDGDFKCRHMPRTHPEFNTYFVTTVEGRMCRVVATGYAIKDSGRGTVIKALLEKTRGEIEPRYGSARIFGNLKNRNFFRRWLFFMEELYGVNGFGTTYGWEWVFPPNGGADGVQRIVLEIDARGPDAAELVVTINYANAGCAE